MVSDIETVSKGETMTRRTIDYVVNPRYWDDMEGFIAEVAFEKMPSSHLYQRIEKISEHLYVAERFNSAYYGEDKRT